MSLEFWKQNGWLREHKTSSEEVASILALVDRDLADAAYLDNCRRKRNVGEYDAVGTISEKEAADLLRTVQELKVEVQKWLQQNYPELCSHEGQGEREPQ